MVVIQEYRYCSLQGWIVSEYVTVCYTLCTLALNPVHIQIRSILEDYNSVYKHSDTYFATRYKDDNLEILLRKVNNNILVFGVKQHQVGRMYTTVYTREDDVSIKKLIDGALRMESCIAS